MSSPVRDLSRPLQLTVPIAPEIAPQLVSFKPVKKSFVIHNAKPRAVETMYGGTMFIIPATHEVNKDCELDADGDPIPGTRVIEDFYEYDERLRSERLVIDAERAVILILGIQMTPDGSSSILTSQHAITGLSLFPRHPPKSLWKPAVQAGEQRAFLAAVHAAHYTVHAYAAQDANRKANGKPPVAPGPDYEHACYLIEEYNKMVKAEADVRLAPYKEEAGAREAAEELEFQAFYKARIHELVETATVNRTVDKAAMFKDMMKDPEVRKIAQREWRFRRKGHAPIEQEKLDELIEAGREIEDEDE